MRNLPQTQEGAREVHINSQRRHHTDNDHLFLRDELLQKEVVLHVGEVGEFMLTAATCPIVVPK